MALDPRIDAIIKKAEKYPATVAPTIRVEMTFIHDALGPGYLSKVAWSMYDPQNYGINPRDRRTLTPARFGPFLMEMLEAVEKTHKGVIPTGFQASLDGLAVWTRPGLGEI